MIQKLRLYWVLTAARLGPRWDHGSACHEGLHFIGCLWSSWNSSAECRSARRYLYIMSYNTNQDCTEMVCLGVISLSLSRICRLGYLLQYTCFTQSVGPLGSKGQPWNCKYMCGDCVFVVLNLALCLVFQSQFGGFWAKKMESTEVCSFCWACNWCSIVASIQAKPCFENCAEKWVLEMLNIHVMWQIGCKVHTMVVVGGFWGCTVEA